jgi:hypothetical protein
MPKEAYTCAWALRLTISRFSILSIINGSPNKQNNSSRLYNMQVSLAREVDILSQFLGSGREV